MQLTQEHEEVQRTLKRFIEKEINPHVDEWEEKEIFPAHQVFKGLGDLGLLGLTKPVEYGGAGLDYSFSMIMAESLGHIDCGGVPMAIGVQTDMATPALARFGSHELKEEFLRPANTSCAGKLSAASQASTCGLISSAMKRFSVRLISSCSWVSCIGVPARSVVAPRPIGHLCQALAW